MAHFNENQIFDANRTRFFSDPHFGHDNVLRFEQGFHKFANIEEHDWGIVSNWNAVVSPTDHIFFLGDASMPKVKLGYVVHIFKHLPGKIHWILGNHDAHIDDEWKRQLMNVADIVEFVDYKEIFLPVEEKTNMKLEEPGKYLRQIILFHYPIHSFNGQNRYAYHFYGHTHEKVQPIRNSYSVCAALTYYAPADYLWLRSKIIENNARLDRLGEPGL